MENGPKKHEFLYVAHNFPPLIGAGVARTEQNCRLLPSFGWRPTVLTSMADNNAEVDGKYADMGVEVLRASGGIKENRLRALPRGGRRLNAGYSIQLLRFLAKWMLIPDRHVLWKLPAQRMALKASKNHDWQCVLATMPPMSAGWVGKFVAERLRLPFVLEYRDVVSEDYKRISLGFLRKAAKQAIERSLVRAAAKIITVSPGIKNWLVQRHGLGVQDVEMIPTGFMLEDREYFSSLPQLQNERFTMIYAGTFQRERKPDTVLEAVRRILERGIIDRQKLRIVFISNLAQSAISRFGLDDIAETLPMVSHEETFEWYAKSDVLLLICDKCDYQNVTYPGKLFEYLMTGKPILGLMGKDSVSAEVLTKAGTGPVVDADDVEEAAAQIAFLYRQWEAKMLKTDPNEKIIEQFNCHGLVEHIASVLEQVLGSS